MDTINEYQSEFKQDVTASEIVESNMNKYARHVLLELLPNHVDGFKLIHRRILLALGTTDDKMKGSALIGKVMGRYHPHGDASIYGAIIRLAQPFNQIHPFVKVFGNVGDYSGEAAAAARYIDVTSSEFSRDVFFNKTNSKTLTYIPSETGVGVEPAYFIPVIPTALITGTHTIAVGVKSIVPYLELQNVCSLVEKFVTTRKENPLEYSDKLPALSKYLVPDTPAHSLLRNAKELIAKYQIGEFGTSVIMDGILELYPDSIHVRTIPYGRDLKDTLEILGKLMKSANFITANFQEVSDISTGFEYGDVKLLMKRSVDPFSVIDDLKRAIRFTVKQNYLWNFTNKNGTLLELTPFDILARWYDIRCRSILGDLKYSSSDLFKQYRRLLALIVVADHTDEVLTIFKKADNREATIEPLCTRFKLTENQAKYLSTLQMHQITKQGKDALLQELESVKGKISQLQTKFTDIDNIIVSESDFIKNKYKEVTKRRLKYPSFIGAVNIVGSGFIQYESLKELCVIEKRWNKKDLSIIGYPTGCSSVLVRNGDLITSDKVLAHPKEFKADEILPYKYKPKHSIHFGNGLIFRTSDIFFKSDSDRKSIPICDEFMVLDSKYKLLQYKATDVTKRLALSAEGVKTDLKFVSSTFGESAIVVFVNEKKQNQLVFELVKVGDKMDYPGLGRIHIYGIYNPNDMIILSIEGRHSFRSSIRHLYIPNPTELLKGATRITCMLSRKQFSNNIRMTPIDKHSDIWTYKN